jgi:biopolymer transport protein ExbB/TolQ
MNQPASLSLIALFENADIVVKFVLLQLGGSAWSWAAIVDKIVRLRAARLSAQAWATRPVLGAQLRQLELRLPFLTTLGSTAPFSISSARCGASCAASTR